MPGPWKFGVRFGAAALLQFALVLASPLRGVIDRFSEYLATGSAGLIRLFGGTCEAHAAFLNLPGTALTLEIQDGCNGLNVVILLWAAVVAFPARWQWRAWGIAGGFLAIQLLNLGRIISLFYLAQFSKEAFDFAHHFLWEALILLDAMLVFGIWSRQVKA